MSGMSSQDTARALARGFAERSEGFPMRSRALVEAERIYRAVPAASPVGEDPIRVLAEALMVFAEREMATYRNIAINEAKIAGMAVVDAAERAAVDCAKAARLNIERRLNIDTATVGK